MVYRKDESLFHRTGVYSPVLCPIILGHNIFISTVFIEFHIGHGLRHISYIQT